MCSHKKDSVDNRKHPGVFLYIGKNVFKNRSKQKD